ncbi:MAG: membrane protein insertion efficiency factor YidD [Bacteroidales bacterium]|nr:membrane protein insertion efficiency factor YidD [Bacteroidales bacterium]
MKPFMDIPKNRKYIFIIICISFACKLTGYSQEISDTSAFKTLFIPEVHTEDHSKYLENQESEMKVLISFSFLFYKKYISSQDVEACVFHPSCSEYTIEAVENKGAIIGLLDGFDRLLRCHSFVNGRDYPYNTVTKKYHDPH